MVTDVTGMVLFDTETWQMADLPPAEAVMVEVPSATAVIRPLSETVATDCLDDAQVTSLSVASEGRTVAFSWTVSTISRRSL